MFGNAFPVGSDGSKSLSHYSLGQATIYEEPEEGDQEKAIY